MLASNLEHCGGCNQACAQGQMCVNGMCRRLSCAKGQTLCGTFCVDTRRDPNHCGGCRKRCVSGVCLEGQCVLHAQMLESSHGHNCVVSAGRLKCWGENSAAQLGYNDMIRRDRVPAEQIDVGEQGVKQLALGERHSCVVLDDASLKCWGQSSYGQTGYDVADQSVILKPLVRSVDLGGKKVKQLTAGFTHTCVLLSDETVRCWGTFYLQGQKTYLVARSKDAQSYTFSGKKVKQLRSGDQHICVLLEDHRVLCWGNNDRGQLGYGDRKSRKQPVDTFVNMQGTKTMEVVAGVYHTCALSETGQLRCWGENAGGQLGVGDTVSRLKPDAVIDLRWSTGRTMQVSAGMLHTCAVSQQGKLKCWGRNKEGQLGYGDARSRRRPDDVVVDLKGAKAKRVWAGKVHTCVLLTDQSVRCWGKNTRGQLGHQHMEPTQIPLFEPALKY
ncbi:MAG: hypothetical protein AAGJ35_02105 [Myxococcota bacterium]